MLQHMIKRRGKGRPVGSLTGKYSVNLNGKRTILYNKWLSMHGRCNSTAPHFMKSYGSKGITVCQRWQGRTGYDNFVDDMGQPPKGYTLERINNDLGYGPENCRWATWKEQAQNRSKTGPPINPDCLSQKAKRAGIPYHVAYQRIFILGWSEDRALTTPVQPMGRQKGWRKLDYADPDKPTQEVSNSEHTQKAYSNSHL